MHRTMDISVPSGVTEPLLGLLEQQEHVIGLGVSRGASIKPPGDVITVHVLNRGADAVLHQVAQSTPEYSIVTAETSSIIDPKLDAQVENDVDEALWEELETGLRHQGRITSNFLVLMALGGVLAAIGLTSEGAAQATALIAASIVAPGFEPIAKMALGLSLGRWNVVGRGLTSTLAGYAVFILTAGLAFLLLRLFGAVEVSDFTENTELAHLAHPTAKEVLLSSAGAISGAVIMAAYRRSVIAGALIALVILPAAAVTGMGLSLGRPDLAGQGLERVGLDVALILGWGTVVFTIKQRTVHRRSPLV
jgi:Domain of unknown function (DUF389)